MKNKKLSIIGVVLAIIILICTALFLLRYFSPNAQNGQGLGIGPGGRGQGAGQGVSLKNGNGKIEIPLVQFNPAPVPASEIGKHPNILLVIADDMGVDADPCHSTIGAEKPNMPNLSAMCKNGVVFDDVWVNSVCSPTRSTMISGQYAFRTGVTDVDKVLSPDIVSLPDALADANKVPVPYANAFIGKWHLSGNKADLNAPSALGVQYFSGFLAGGVRNYFDYYLDEQGVETREKTYTTTLFTDKAISWIKSQEQKDPNRPWFMWLAYNAPHAPFHMPPKDLIKSDKLKNLSGSTSDIQQNPRPYYLASLEALDTEMGRLLAGLSAEDQANTVVIFIGDNGTPSEVIQQPFDSDQAKTSVYEGGVRAVLVASGAGVTRKGERETALINGTDIYATILELAGYRTSGASLAGAKTKSTEALDSISFKNAFTNKAFSTSGLARTFLYTEWVPAKGPSRNYWAVRDNQYKLINNARQSELYDLKADPFEKNNLNLGSLSSALKAEMQKLQEIKESL